MYLRRIEIKGFKSFANKTILELSSKITAVVGPNGSGKSNIVDAIRWALGEQSLKNIRAERSEDLIFAGNQSEKSSGLAEVSLVFDNSDKRLSFDFDEISIARRINRDNQGEYFLNKSAGRLKEITEILAAAQLGLKGFSIINQGAVENILRVSCQERRMMLIEILGLRTLEIKKSEAKRKLDHSLNNLDKVRSLKEEILPHLRSLKRQANKWERQEKVQLELKDLETEYFTSLYLDLKINSLNIDKSFKEIEGQFNAIREKIKLEESKIDLNNRENFSLDDQISKLNLESDALKNEKSQLFHELGKLEGLLELTNKLPVLASDTNSKVKIKVDLLESRINAILDILKNTLSINEAAAIHEHIKKVMELITEVIKPQEDISGHDFKDTNVSQKENYELRVKEIGNRMNEIDEIINKKAQELASLREKNISDNNNFRETIRKIEEERLSEEKYSREYNEIKLAREKYLLRHDDLKRRLEEAGFDYKDFIGRTASQDSISLSESQERELEIKIIKLRRELGEIGAIDKAVLDEYQATKERYDFLENQINDLEKAIIDLKRLIKELAHKIENDFRLSLKEINEEFNQYVRLMFNGGRAHLDIIKPKPSIIGDGLANVSGDGSGLGSNELEKELDDDLQMGVDIKIDIPKTKLKGLESLSGGEKALVAICLLFAIISKSSPPILIMDEIDAALDEANSKRFSKILQELSSKTQFVLITHNRTTMEGADCIYGVTLNSGGTSELLSLHFEDAKAYTVRK